MGGAAGEIAKRQWAYVPEPAYLRLLNQPNLQAGDARTAVRVGRLALLIYAGVALASHLQCHLLSRQIGGNYQRRYS